MDEPQSGVSIGEGNPSLVSTPLGVSIREGNPSLVSKPVGVSIGEDNPSLVSKPIGVSIKESNPNLVFPLPSKEKALLYCKQYLEDSNVREISRLCGISRLPDLPNVPVVSRMEMSAYLNFKKSHPETPVSLEEFLEFLGK